MLLTATNLHPTIEPIGNKVIIEKPGRSSLCIRLGLMAIQDLTSCYNRQL
jgi:hypothetical protein